MTYQEYLKSIGYDDAGIATMATAFGGPDKLAKAFEKPMRDLEAAQASETAAKNERDDFQKFYQDDILPKISTVYQDAIQQRTTVAALQERLKAAKEYGFLSDDKLLAGAVPGMPAGSPVDGAAPPNPVPGSPSGGQPSAPDSRYVSAEVFARETNNIPAMLGRLTKMSNEHFSLFGSPLLDVDTLITEAQDSKGKKNVLQIWEEKYKVKEKRAEITAKATADHDRQVGEEAIRKYASEHGQPFLQPGRTSVASHFTPQSSEEGRKPWKGAADRQRDRRNKLLTESQHTGSTGARVQ